MAHTVVIQCQLPILPPSLLPPTRPNLAPATQSGSTMHGVRCLVAIGKTLCLTAMFFRGFAAMWVQNTGRHTHTMHKHTDTYKQTSPLHPPLDVWLTNEGPRPIPLHLQQRRPESHGYSEPTDSPAHRFRQGGAGRDDIVWCHSGAEKLRKGGHPYSATAGTKTHHQHLFASSTFHALSITPHTHAHTHLFSPIVYLLTLPPITNLPETTKSSMPPGL